MGRKNPAAEAVRTPRYRPQRVEKDILDEQPGCWHCGKVDAPPEPPTVFVHGHIECCLCGQNLDPCCQGGG